MYFKYIKYNIIVYGEYTKYSLNWGGYDAQVD